MGERREPGLGEFDLIDRYFARRAGGGSGVGLGIGDDAALLSVPQGSELVVSVDTLVCGRHFPEDTDPRSIGHRALAVNLSDIAAMGAKPAWATLALTLPSAEASWLERFSSGFLELAAAHGVALVGGDTTRGPLSVTVQIMGHVPRGTALLRSGARPADLIAVTGTLGDAGAGLAIRTGRLSPSGTAREELIRRFDYPQPRVAFALAARGIASAAMDISDGLAGDLAKLAAASGVAARVDLERLPLSAALRASVDAARALEWALGAGDDYEILLAVPAPRFAELESHAARLNLMLSSIGEFAAGSGVAWSKRGSRVEMESTGFDHFA
ncbi:MAG TPA: thiamine-phosphate kinase [Steroidobacteraceae bacterium]|jgi:thiamine-monophosphate kinase|nr:thiamine-phosphate kinase [Steroidobacteraceae bacterium]